MRLTYDSFKDYLGRINKLYELTSSFIKYYNDVIKQANGKKVYELQEDVRSMILGGLKPNGEYAENAYALFIRDFTGLYIEDPKLYVSKLRLGMKPYVMVVVEETPFVEFIQLLNNISEFILNKAKEQNLGYTNSNGVKSDTGKQGVENIIAELIKTSHELSVGVHNFSTGVWGLRKITPHYMKKAYGSVPENLLKILGFSKLWSVKDYELWGFPDYFTEIMLYSKHVSTEYGGYSYYYISINGIPTLSKSLKNVQTVNPVKPKTLGGAICILNEVIWRYNSLLHETMSKWYEGVINIEEKYVKEAWQSLNNIGWSIPEYLKDLYAEFKELLDGAIGSSSGSPFKFLIYDEDGIVSKYVQWVYRRSYERSGFVEYKLSHYLLLPGLFDDLIPAIFLGVVDTPLHHTSSYLNYRKALLIIVRTKRSDLK